MVTVQSLTKRFDKFTALKQFNMHVNKGAIYGLVGPNGSGKTTLIKHLAGIYQPDEGSIKVNHHTVQEEKENIVYISDDIYFFSTYSVLEMAKFYAGLYPNFSWDTFHKLKNCFNIDAKRRATKLSKGMIKQVAFWIGMSCMPKILLLDEPIDGLDPIMKKRVWNLLQKDVKERKTTVIVSSHNLKELEDVCTNIGIIRNGKMVLEKDLKKMDTNVHKVQLVLEKKVGWDSNLHILSEEKQGSVINLIVLGNKKEIENILKSYQPKVIDFLPLSLEEVFMYEMGGEQDGE